jgi:hypothetical protein
VVSTYGEELVAPPSVYERNASPMRIDALKRRVRVISPPISRKVVVVSCAASRSWSEEL